MMKKKILWCMMFFLPMLIQAQFMHQAPVGVALFNNATLLPPASFTAIFNQPFHPGISVSYEFGWKTKEYSKWFQDASLGFFNHRYAYNAILLVSKAGYRRNLGHLSMEASVHAGYMHMILNTDRLVKNDDGTYEAKKGFGRPQFVTGAGLGLGYNIGDRELGRRIFLTYDVRLQMPFVKSYVPILPNGIVALGYQFRID